MLPARTIASLGLLAAAWLGPRLAIGQSKLAPEVGWNYGEIETARTAALAGATRAFGAGTTSLYSNPGAMTLNRVYHLEALAQIIPESSRQTYGVSAVDSVTSRLAGGIGGHYGIQDPDGLKRKWTDVRLALAYPFSDKLHAGVGGRYLKLRQDGLGPLGGSFASGGSKDEAIVDSFSFDAGIVVRPIQQLAIGVLGTNLTYPANGLQPTTLGGGVGFGSEDFTIEGNFVADFTSYTSAQGGSRTTFRAMLGGEYLAADHFPLRLGYRFDEGQKSHAISGGLGYVDPQFAIEAAVRRTVAGPETMVPSTTVVIGLQYFLESTGITRSPAEFQ